MIALVLMGCVQGTDVQGLQDPVLERAVRDHAAVLRGERLGGLSGEGVGLVSWRLSLGGDDDDDDHHDDMITIMI
jgi:hypothetical protein